MTIKREQLKTLIEGSTNVKQADQYIEKYCGFKTIREKIAFLEGMFDVSIASRQNGSVRDDYEALLRTIINAKWNQW